MRLKSIVDTDAMSADLNGKLYRSYTIMPSYLYTYRLSGKSPKNRELGTLSASTASIFLFRRDFALNLCKTWNEHSDFEDFGERDIHR